MRVASKVRDYIRDSEVRDQYRSEQRSVMKEKIELNRLRLERGRLRSMIEKQAADRQRNLEEKRETE